MRLPNGKVGAGLRDRYRKRLRRYLELASDEAFVQLVWAANLLQSGHSTVGLRFLLNVHTNAITEDLASPHHIHKWELETLVNELLVVPKRTKPIRGQWRHLDCRKYNALIDILNTLRDLENSEAGIKLRHMDVFKEMPRIAARQFDWQRGWANIPQFYRSTFIYGQGRSAEYFESTHGLTVNEFSLIGFALYALLNKQPVANRTMDFGNLPLSQEKYHAALRLLALPKSEAQLLARSIRRRHWPIAYQPSVLRRFPCLIFGGESFRIRSPLPQLILERVTSGIFYDIVDGPGDVRDEYGRRFEQYAFHYLCAMLPSIPWREEYGYRWRKAETKSPDILWIAGQQARIAFECKATRMSIDARFADDPLSERGYNDIVKAVFQLWRYFSHCRRGLTGYEAHEKATGVVLTLDSWLLMGSSLIDDLMEKAIAMAADKDPDITPEDRKPILFCAMTDLEETLATADAETFEAAIDLAVAEERQGWKLSSSLDEVRPENVASKAFPFKERMGDLLPWRDWIEDERKRRTNQL